jgi:hypothetical protein
MKKRIVICNNDFPRQVMADGATEEGAAELCRQLNVQDYNIQKEVSRSSSLRTRIYYHYKIVPETSGKELS